MKLFSQLTRVGIGMLFLAQGVWAGPARILHQTPKNTIVRIAADERTVAWQEFGGNDPVMTIGVLNTDTGVKRAIAAPKRPFGPVLSGGFLFVGAGGLLDGVDPVLFDLVTGKSYSIDNPQPWILEPAVETVTTSAGKEVRMVWERSDNMDGKGLRIAMSILKEGQVQEAKELAVGPALLKNEIPSEYQDLVRNEFPEVSGDFIVYQNNEYGTPNIYRQNWVTGQVERLAPSILFQERAATYGMLTAWEESERGYAVSNDSSLYLHDAVTGQVKALNPEPGFHYQARIWGKYVAYGAKRQPAPTTPSVRLYDTEEGKEYNAAYCFPGSIFDHAVTSQGMYATQRLPNGSGSRLLFATYDQIKKACR